MISDRELEKMIQPILTRQEAINAYVINLIAQRVKEIGELIPSDVQKLIRLLKTGVDVRKINKEIARLSGMNERAIRLLIRDIALDAYKDAKPFYDYREKAYIPFDKNEELQKVVKSVAKQTANTYTNLSRSRAFMLRNPKDLQHRIPTPLTKAYYSVIDEAVQASQSGVIDYSTAMKRTLEQLADSGLRYVEYHPDSGRIYTQSLEAAVKRNLMTGIRAINQGVQDEVGRQYGADGKEITVHEMSAPDHEPIQGHQFTNEEYEKLQNGEPFEDVNGNKFEAIARPIGEYNCRHFTYSIIVGISKPNFTEKQLQENIARNHKGYTDSTGKHRTLYECTQKQRELERKIRKAKTNVVMGKKAGNKQMVAESEAQLADAMKQYTAFSEACGLKKRLLNTKIAEY